MALIESYQKIKKSIVAFCPKYVPRSKEQGPPLFPPIFGTGFVVDEDGIIVTNEHVVRAFGLQFRPPETKKDDWAVYALMLYPHEKGQLEIPLEVLGTAQISDFNPGPAYYGPKKPDLAFVHVKAKGLPTLKVSGNCTSSAKVVVLSLRRS